MVVTPAMGAMVGIDVEGNKVSVGCGTGEGGSVDVMKTGVAVDIYSLLVCMLQLASSMTIRHSKRRFEECVISRF